MSRSIIEKKDYVVIDMSHVSLRDNTNDNSIYKFINININNINNENYNYKQYIPSINTNYLKKILTRSHKEHNDEEKCLNL